METNKGILGKMIINIIAFIILFEQCMFFIFSALNQSAPSNTMESLKNGFNFIAIFCSLITIIIFALLYNLGNKHLNKKGLNWLFLVITAVGVYVHISQLFIMCDFVFAASILLLFDCYIVRRTLNNLFHKST